MAYNVVLRRNGAKVGHFGPFTTKKQAIAQGQALADDAARDVVVSVEPQRKKATTKKKRTNTRRSAIKKGDRFENQYGVWVVDGPAYGTVDMWEIYLSSRGKGHAKVESGSALLKHYKKKRTNTRRSNPSRGTFTSKTYAYYTVANGKLTSGHGSREAALKQANGNKDNVKTARQAQKYLGKRADGSYRSLTSSAAWYNEPRRNPRTRKNSYHVSPNEDPHSFNKPILKKLRSMKSNPASKSILKRIALANKWIAFAMKRDIRGIDNSSTWSSIITYTHLIKVSAGNNRATVKYTEGYAPGKKESETYNLNNTDTYSDTGVSALRYAINTYIIKPIKRGAKDEGITIPASLR